MSLPKELSPQSKQVLGPSFTSVEQDLRLSPTPGVRVVTGAAGRPRVTQPEEPSSPGGAHRPPQQSRCRLAPGWGRRSPSPAAPRRKGSPGSPVTGSPQAASAAAAQRGRTRQHLPYRCSGCPREHGESPAARRGARQAGAEGTAAPQRQRHHRPRTRTASTPAACIAGNAHAAVSS